ncbi:HNH endonuclease signature motif containing protein [Planobispora rosea]|uniref:HNH endonuclease signature motif containing protein n=1 Tax=Planobispora rosea TaxID=35762 RepID=UPI0009FD66DD|nr:HNH endonuclease signature motif containing protein [Planobispora rosea]
MSEDVSKRFWAFVDASGDCWEWTGGRQSRGYGHFSVTRDVRHLAHRFAYEDLVGPIPEGFQIDHLCRNVLCVNPDHLEAVTQQENIARSNGLGVVNAAKTHCPYGHPYDEANTYWRGKKRTCRECRRKQLPSPRPPKSCKVCGASFRAPGPALCCSDECRKVADRQRAAARAAKKPPRRRGRTLVTEWLVEPDLDRLRPKS